MSEATELIGELFTVRVSIDHGQTWHDESVPVTRQAALDAAVAMIGQGDRDWSAYPDRIVVTSRPNTRERWMWLRTEKKGVSAVMRHHPNCIENARGAIAENNGWTLADDPMTPEEQLTPETEAMALVWLAEGTIQCWQDGEECV
jgi:hypothetical protein